MAIDPSDIPSTGGECCAATAVAGYPIHNPAVNETARRFGDVIRNLCCCARNLRATGRQHDVFKTPSPQIPAWAPALKHTGNMPDTTCRLTGRAVNRERNAS
jgi:hypothetical protein